MPISDNTPVSRTVTAFFDDQPAAQKAIDELVASGIPQDSIRLAEGSGTTAVEQDAKATAHKGFWDELKDLFLPDQDRYSYAEGLSRGGYLVSVSVGPSAYDRARDILDSSGAIDMDSREAEWTAGGWSGTPADDLIAPSAMGESGLLTEPLPASLTRDTADRRARLRSFSVQNDLGSGYPVDRTLAATEASSPAAGSAAGDLRSRITEHMEVIAADGTRIGAVDHLDGPDRIKLTRNDSPDGQHHYVPLTWVDHVDTHVHLNRSLAEIKAQQRA